MPGRGGHLGLNEIAWPAHLVDWVILACYANLSGTVLSSGTMLMNQQTVHMLA